MTSGWPPGFAPSDDDQPKQARPAGGPAPPEPEPRFLGARPPADLAAAPAPLSPVPAPPVRSPPPRPAPRRVAAIEQHDHDVGGAASARSARIFIGLAAIAIGLIITALTYSSARGGGTYVVAYGPVIFGVITLFRGLASRD